MVARGRLAADRGDFAGSAREYRDAVARWETTNGDPLQIAEARVALAQSLSRVGDAPGAWRAARGGGDGVIGIAAARVGGGNAQPLDHKSLGIFDTTLDAAWAVRTPRDDAGRSTRLFLDSGIGGLSVLAPARALLPRMPVVLSPTTPAILMAPRPKPRSPRAFRRCSGGWPSATTRG